jgi:methyl coenzyme M reductase subunit D
MALVIDWRAMVVEVRGEALERGQDGGPARVALESHQERGSGSVSDRGAELVRGAGQVLPVVTVRNTAARQCRRVCGMLLAAAASAVPRRRSRSMT